MILSNARRTSTITTTLTVPSIRVLLLSSNRRISSRKQREVFFTNFRSTHRHSRSSSDNSRWSSSTSSYQSSSPSSSSILKVLPEVSDAISNGKPVVALESTILAHGLPYPENIELAHELSTIIRDRGAIPATIAVKDGYCRVGLTMEELKDLAISGVEQRASKCSTRDLPFLLAKQRQSQSQSQPNSQSQSVSWGATTVASTMHIAHMAGIQTFVTGGTGGVHRGAESSMDISADLLELARTPVVVISAGVKSILDIHRTLETLETNGVPVASYGTDEFPAFFSPTSGVSSPARVDSAEEVSESFLASLELGLKNGMLIAVPNCDPAGESVEQAIQETIEEANALGIVGRDVTPYILKKVAEKTKGDSLKSNTALVKGNAAVGADIAVAIANAIAIAKKNEKGAYNMSMPSASLSRSGRKQSPRFVRETEKPQQQSEEDDEFDSKVVVMGGSVIDLVAKPATGQKLLPGTSNPGKCYESDGGVGRNIAEVLGRLGSKPTLFTAVGQDSRGSALMQRMEQEYDIRRGRRQRVEVVPDSNTATYLAVLNSDGDLHTAIADMEVLEKIPIPDEECLSKADYLIVDANPPIHSLVRAAQNACWASAKVCFEPTSVPKAYEVGKNSQFMSAISYAFPNLDELFAMAGTRDDAEVYNDVEIKSAAKQVLNRCHPTESHLIITMGANGVILASKYELKPIIYQHFEAEASEVHNCTGAGDTLAGSFVAALLKGYSIEEAVKFGMEKARLSLVCEDSAISPHLEDCP